MLGVLEVHCYGAVQLHIGKQPPLLYSRDCGCSLKSLSCSFKAATMMVVGNRPAGLHYPVPKVCFTFLQYVGLCALDTAQPGELDLHRVLCAELGAPVLL